MNITAIDVMLNEFRALCVSYSLLAHSPAQHATYQETELYQRRILDKVQRLFDEQEQYIESLEKQLV